jgi:hypothetical protein
VVHAAATIGAFIRAFHRTATAISNLATILSSLSGITGKLFTIGAAGAHTFGLIAHPTFFEGRAFIAALEGATTAITYGSTKPGTTGRSAGGAFAIRSSNTSIGLCVANPTCFEGVTAISTIEGMATVISYGAAVAAIGIGVTGACLTHAGRSYARILFTHPTGFWAFRRTFDGSTTAIANGATIVATIK